MKKRGFTLVELLAVIAIIGILATIGVTAVIKIYNDSIKKTMIVQESNVADASRSYLEDYCIDPLDGSYKCPSSYENNSDTRYICLSDLQENEKDNYINKVTYKNEDCKGIIVFSKDDDGEYTKAKTYLYCDYDSRNNKYNYITDESLDTSLYPRCNISSGILPGGDDTTTTTTTKPVDTACTFNGELVQGATFVSGQYTYKYKQELDFDGWKNIFTDGWGVTLTDYNSTDAVTTKLCNSINEKPIVSMSYMFAFSKAKTIDMSSFNTSNVVNMDGMFWSAEATTLDVSNFDTSKVKNMQRMFNSTSATSINLSNFNTSNVTDMSGMFQSANASVIDVSSFDTSKVTLMPSMFESTKSSKIILGNFKLNSSVLASYLFAHSEVTTLDLSSFDTSSATSLYGMFYDLKLTTLDLTNFDTSNVTNMYSMFELSSNLKTIYVGSKFNVNKVTNSTAMFKGCTSLVGGSGTKYNSSYIDKTYARIDGGTSSPGYFTSKNSSTNAGTYIRNLSPKGLETTARDGLYRFVGTSNNYVSVGGISYRIIGITDNSTINTSLGLKDGQLKLIKATPVETHVWSSSRSYDYPFGNSSNDLYAYLNDTVINNTNVIPSSFKNSISSVKWYNGDVFSSGVASSISSYEMGSMSSVTAKLGLMYLSDYVYSNISGGSTNCYNSACTSSWIYNSSYSQWTMSRAGRSNNIGYAAACVSTSGKTSNSMVVSSLNYSPVFYLNQNVTISSGNGSSSSPFVISVK